MQELERKQWSKTRGSLEDTGGPVIDLYPIQHRGGLDLLPVYALPEEPETTEPKASDAPKQS